MVNNACADIQGSLDSSAPEQGLLLSTLDTAKIYISKNSLDLYQPEL